MLVTKMGFYLEIKMWDSVYIFQFLMHLEGCTNHAYFKFCFLLCYIGSKSSFTFLFQLEACLEKEGDFWMSYNDWLKTFTHIEVIHLDSDTAKDEPSLIGELQTLAIFPSCGFPSKNYILS